VRETAQLDGAQSASHEDEDGAPQGAGSSQGSFLDSSGMIKLHGKVGSNTALLAGPLAEGSAADQGKAEEQSNLCIYDFFPASSTGCWQVG